jgi:hypothetical protein
MYRFSHTFAAALIVILVAALLAMCALSLTGCTSLDEGRVVSKDYQAAYTSTWYYSMQVGESWVMMPMESYHPASWSIDIQNDGGDRDTWTVDAALYESVAVGDSVRRSDAGVLITKG